MSLTPNFCMSADIQRQSLITDSYGMDRLGDWATVYTVPCWLDNNLKKVVEVVGNRDESNSDGLCFLAAGTDLLPNDRLVIDGFIYQVFSVPGLIRDGFDGSVNHIEVRIKRYSG